MDFREYEVEKIRLLIALEKNHEYYSKEVTNLLDIVLDDELLDSVTDKLEDLREFYDKNITPLKSQLELLENNYKEGLI